HEINNPLSALLAGVQLLEMGGNTPEEEREMVSAVGTHARRIRDAVRRLTVAPPGPGGAPGSQRPQYDNRKQRRTSPQRSQRPVHPVARQSAVPWTGRSPRTLPVVPRVFLFVVVRCPSPARPPSSPATRGAAAPPRRWTMREDRCVRVPGGRL